MQPRTVKTKPPAHPASRMLRGFSFSPSRSSGTASASPITPRQSKTAFFSRGSAARGAIFTSGTDFPILLSASRIVKRRRRAALSSALSKAGIVKATRGLGGGDGLNRDPKEIRLVQVVEVFEGSRARLGCLLGKDLSCSDERPCSAHARWREIRRKWRPTGAYERES